MSELDLKHVAGLAKSFLASEYGEYLMSQLGVLHYGYHKDAESAKTMEQKAMLVERAAAVREVIDLIMREPNALEAGLLDEDKKADEP